MVYVTRPLRFDNWSMSTMAILRQSGRLGGESLCDARQFLLVLAVPLLCCKIRERR
jgi:hypothetical protein